MILAWSRLAIADREAIFSHIEQDNPHAAIRLDALFAAAAGSLLEFSGRGRPGRVETTRELVVSGTPYIIVYAVSTETVRVLRVLHGARQWPEPR